MLIVYVVIECLFATTAIGLGSYCFYLSFSDGYKLKKSKWTADRRKEE